jgi:hypothetical protein
VELVESCRRAFLTAGTGNPSMPVEITRHFETRAEEIAAGLGAAYGHAVLVAVTRERERLLQDTRSILRRYDATLWARSPNRYPQARHLIA